MTTREDSSLPLSPRRRALFIVLMMLLPVFFLLLVEAAFRLMPGEDLFPETQTGFVEPDPDLIWRLKPRADGPLRTNELGLRDGPYRADADVRILLLGDSVSWGNGVGDVQRIFPSLLEKRLESRLGKSVEIVNSGVPGYSTFQQLRYFELKGLALRPDAVMIQVCLNDVTERYLTVAEYGGQTHFLGVDTRAAIGGLQGLLIRNSRAAEAFFRTLQSRAQDRERFVVKNLASDELEPELEEAWKEMLGELGEIRRLAEENDLPLLMTIAPFRFQIDAPQKLRQPQDRLLAWARDRGVPAVDLLPPIVALPESIRMEAFNDPSHFSELGHAIVAEALAERTAEWIETDLQ